MEGINKELQEFNEYMKTFCFGERRAETSRELAKEFGTEPENIRLWVRTLRGFGSPICSGQTGYYYAGSIREVKKTVQWLGHLVTMISESRNNLVVAAMENFDPASLGTLFAEI